MPCRKGVGVKNKHPMFNAIQPMDPAITNLALRGWLWRASKTGCLHMCLTLPGFNRQGGIYYQGLLVPCSSQNLDQELLLPSVAT